jgi:hypothetical protein
MFVPPTSMTRMRFIVGYSSLQFRPRACRFVAALPCRVDDPDRKGKVEAGVGHAQKTPMRGLRFESLEAAQAYLDRWETHWADARIHGTTKRQVAAMFAEEQCALGPLPLEPFRYYRFGVRTVHLDGCIEIDAAYYSGPPGWIGRPRRCAMERPRRPPPQPAHRKWPVLQCRQMAGFALSAEAPKRRQTGLSDGLNSGIRGAPPQYRRQESTDWTERVDILGFSRSFGF